VLNCDEDDRRTSELRIRAEKRRNVTHGNVKTYSPESRVSKILGFHEKKVLGGSNK
jgi:hypothetical protein